MNDRNPEKYLLSDACFLAAAQSATLESKALRLAQSIRDVRDAPVMVVSAPNPGLGLPQSDVSSWFPPFYEIERNGDSTVLGAMFNETCQRIASAFRLTIIPPLAEIAASGVFNKREFSRLPENLDADPNLERMSAMMHASDDYGVLLAKHVFREL